MKKGKRFLAAIAAVAMSLCVMPRNLVMLEVHAAVSTTDVVPTSTSWVPSTTYGDPNQATFTVGEEFIWSDSTSVKPYAGYVAGKNNASDGVKNPTTGKFTNSKNGAIPAVGSFIKFVVSANAVNPYITIVAKAKTNLCDFVDATDTSQSIDPAPIAAETKYKVIPGHTYYYYGEGTKPCIYCISISTGFAEVDWDKLDAPILGTPVLNGSNISVPYTASIGDLGGEKLTVDMINTSGKVVDTQTTKVDSPEGKNAVSFAPAASGDYTFKATLSRTDKTDKTSAVVSYKGYVLPLAKPVVTNVTSKGNGKAEVIFDTVAEAESYDVTAVDKKSGASVTATATTSPANITVAIAGDEYSFTVTAKRKTDTAVSDAYNATVNKDFEATWNFAAFGQGVNSNRSDCGFTGSAKSGSVQLWDVNGKGKLVPASTDGLSFYYTPISSDMNFTLEADVSVDSWTYTNGQEGFGLMACDRVGKDGDPSVLWNNSYMDSVTKVEYNYANNEVTNDATAPKIAMKLGVGSQEKTGVTASDLKNATSIPAGFTSTMTTLETSCGNMGAGTYNIVANGGTVLGTVAQPITTFHMSIQRNNTGYFVSYTDAAGNTTTKKYYDTKALDQLDKDNVYVGFFASRTAKITCNNIKLTTIDPKDDKPAEKHPVELITPNYQVVSAATSNSSDYTLKFRANADGKVQVADENGNVIANKDVTANEVVSVPTTLALGSNKFNITMTPTAGYAPDKYQEMTSYDAVTISQTVTYNQMSGDYFYVSPEGKSNASGTKTDPLDITTAVKYAQPGQKIVMLAGTYMLTSTLAIPFGTNGTAEKPISLVADPDSTARPVLNFGQNCEGLVACGDHWYFSGFDVTGSQNGKDGIHVCGNYNTFDNVDAYGNGNTGLQISRYSDVQSSFETWPHDNLILNCTSHDNADAGYEDADGFAAKLTVGNNNVFDGCISYNNADDGWDLFAKPETGSIGSVTIRNCVAYANGYGSDGTNEGNGNGFKLGGSSLSGKHVLENCVSFDNKAKGIDSNSCPDIIVKNSTSFNNGASNVALYTTDAANTDFSAHGILSFRTEGVDTAETFKFKGTQDNSKVDNNTNYFWNSTLTNAHNSNGLINSNMFVSTDTLMDYTKHVYKSLPVTRNSDGTINLNGLLVLTSDAIKTIGVNDDGSYASGAALNTYDGKTAGQASEQIKLSGTAGNHLVYPRTTTPTTSTTSARPSTPNTGDATNTLFNAGMLVSSLTVLAAALFLKKKHYC